MTDGASFSSFVKDHLRLMIGNGERPSLKSVAVAAGVCARTAQRHLNQESATFSGILMEVRFERTLDRLKEKRRAVEMARDLGYSDRTAFSRAFKRWTGVPPSKYLANEEPQ